MYGKLLGVSTTALSYQPEPNVSKQKLFEIYLPDILIPNSVTHLLCGCLLSLEVLSKGRTRRRWDEGKME